MRTDEVGALIERARDWKCTVHYKDGHTESGPLCELWASWDGITYLNAMDKLSDICSREVRDANYPGACI